jgi:hypothetical protein
MNLVTATTLVLEELLRRQPLHIDRIQNRIWLRVRISIRQDNLFHTLERMVKKKLVLRHDLEDGPHFNLTIKGMRKAEENRKTAWKIFPPPPSESDSKS